MLKRFVGDVEAFLFASKNFICPFSVNSTQTGRNQQIAPPLPSQDGLLVTEKRFLPVRWMDGWIARGEINLVPF